MVESNYKSGMVALTVCCPLAKQFSYGQCSDDPIEWSWGKCGHRTFIDDVGVCHCTKCGISYFIQQLGFMCNSSSHGTDYVSYKLKDMVFALQMATKAILRLDAEDEEAMDFLENMTKSIRRKWVK